MRLKKIVRLLTVLLVFPFALTAQVTTSTVSGTVKDEKGVALDGATVKVINTQNGLVKFAKTDKTGRFYIPNLDPGGPYTVTISFVGQTIPEKKEIYLQLGNTEVLEFVGESNSNVLTAVVVAGSRVRTVKAGVSSNFNQRIINTIPNISRSITNIATLTPQAGGGNSFGGRDGRYNNTQIDGANFNNNFGLRSDPLPGGSSQPISLDAIDEISVNISPFDVRQANFTGAGLSATTRKGTNTLSGSAFYFWRDQGFIGRKAKGNDVTVTNSSSKIAGIRIGGPIIKNKLFFFVTGEAEQRSTPGILWKPTKAGVTPDANTSRANYDSLAKLRNYLKTKYNYETGAFENFDNFEVKNYKVFGRIDWNITDKHSLSLRYNKYNNIDDQQLNNTTNPSSALPNNRFGPNSLSFQNSNYGFDNNLELFAAELKSNFNSRVSNQLLVTYTKANDGRTTKSSPFPFIDIMNGNPATPTTLSTDNIMSAGYELFTYKNNVENNTLNFNNNFTYNINKHTITAGIGYEKIYVNNSFYRFGTMYYRYNSLDAFVNDSTPTSIAYTFPSIPGKEAVELDFGQASIYAQDEWKINDNFKLSYGIRLDRPVFQNELLSNPAVDAILFKDLNGAPLNIKTGSWPKEKTYISPRVGFNWDIEGDKKKIFRGGVGLFTGRFPFVWFTNQPSNSYTVVKQVSLTLANTGAAGTYTPGNYKFNANPTNYEAQLRALPTNTAITNLAYVDPDFKMPQVLRVSMGLDQKLSDNWTLSLDAIYNKDVNQLLQYNANQAAPIGVMAGPDNRPVFGNSNATRRLNAGISDAMIFTNTSKGFGLVFTAQIARRFAKNWDFSFAYTHTEARDLSGNPGATANSAWNAIPSVTGNNALTMGFNDYATRHRIISYASYKLNWSKFTSTTFSLVYTGFTPGSFSYTVGGDINNDGVSNTDLMYVPNNPSEITFVTNGTFTPAQQSAAFFDYIEQDKYLSKRKGQYAERNGAKIPFFSNLDLRVLQDIYVTKNKKRGLQFSMEIENFTNLINSYWGVTQRTALSNARLLTTATSGTTTAAPTYRLNLINGQLPTKTFDNNITASNTWRMNLGVRLNF
jgi:outer membrane receptor protein involved in Fe transport